MDYIRGKWYYDRAEIRIRPGDSLERALRELRRRSRLNGVFETKTPDTGKRTARQRKRR